MLQTLKSLMLFFIFFLAAIIAVFLSWLIIPVGIALLAGVVGTMAVRELDEKKRDRRKNENERKSRAQEQLRGQDTP